MRPEKHRTAKLKAMQRQVIYKKTAIEDLGGTVLRQAAPPVKLSRSLGKLSDRSGPWFGQASL